MNYFEYLYDNYDNKVFKVNLNVNYRSSNQIIKLSEDYIKPQRSKNAKVDEAVGASAQTVEGIRAIIAGYEIAQKYNLELPIISTAYELVCGRLTAIEALEKLMSRSLKKERYW